MMVKCHGVPTLHRLIRPEGGEVLAVLKGVKGRGELTKEFGTNE
jgi:hypothetical protein